MGARHRLADRDANGGTGESRGRLVPVRGAVVGAGDERAVPRVRACPGKSCKLGSNM